MRKVPFFCLFSVRHHGIPLKGESKTRNNSNYTVKEDDYIKHTHTHPPHQFSYSKGKPHNILQVEIFNLSLTGQSIRFASPLVRTDTFQAVLFSETLAVARNYFSAEALMHIRRIQAQKGLCH